MPLVKKKKARFYAATIVSANVARTSTQAVPHGRRHQTAEYY
jgi:hypothetical protein